MTTKSRQSCPTLCSSIDGSPPGSPVPGILKARTLEWVAISFSNAWKWKVKVKSLSRVRLLATPRTAPYQAPPSMGFSRQEYWSGVPLPSPTTGYYSAIKGQTIWYMQQHGWISLTLLNERGQAQKSYRVHDSIHMIFWKRQKFRVRN